MKREYLVSALILCGLWSCTATINQRNITGAWLCPPGNGEVFICAYHERNQWINEYVVGANVPFMNHSAHNLALAWDTRRNVLRFQFQIGGRAFVGDILSMQPTEPNHE